MSVLANAWFHECKKLKMNQAIFLRVANKAEQIELANDLEKERKDFAQIDLVHASQLFINKVLRNAKQYVVVERRYRTPLTAFLKDENEVLHKISIDPERHRMIRFMLKDGKSRDEVEELMNGLTEEEIKSFYPEE